MSFSGTYKAITNDGCIIPLHYLEPTRFDLDKAPVLLVHGFAANAHMWDSPVQEGSLANYFSRRGYPVFLIDLRFRQGRPPRDWDLDDYVLFDIPTVVDQIEIITGYSQFHWVGHSMGGLLGYMYQVLHGSARILSLSNLGSPGFRCVLNQGHVVYVSRAVSRILSLVINTGRLDLLPPKIMAGLITASFMVANPRKNGIDRGSFQDLQTMNILGNISRGEALQLTTIVNKKGLYSRKYRFRYHNRVDRVQAPLLCIAGDRDIVCPSKLVRQGFDDANALHKKFITLGKKARCQSYYGHLDLIMGSWAKYEVWPHILNWVETFDKQREQALFDTRPSYSLGEVV